MLAERLPKKQEDVSSILTPWTIYIYNRPHGVIGNTPDFHSGDMLGSNPAGVTI